MSYTYKMLLTLQMISRALAEGRKVIFVSPDGTREVKGIRGSEIIFDEFKEKNE